MNPLICRHVDNLKSALLSLPATGEEGFEGLLGEALREITGVPFRLARSGSQFGVDGKPTYEGDAICFEGKRYDGAVDSSEVISKIARLSIHDTDVDVWVLGATCQIGTQLTEDARALGAKDGLFVLVLDWSKMDLPPLAVALAMGGVRVQEFLRKHVHKAKLRQQAIAALVAVRTSADFAPHCDRIRVQCNAPAVGWALAQRENADWLIDAFSNRSKAKARFGQPLSPGDTGTLFVHQRKALTDNLLPYLTVASVEPVVCILGGEGYGKSWIVAQSWLALTCKPLMIFMSPNDFAETAGENDVVALLISKLGEQTGNWGSATTQQKWRRRLEQRRGRSESYSPLLIVIIDGINQRPNCDWARIIESFGDQLSQLGGRLVVTARTPYFQSRVRGRLSVRFTEIHVPEWTAVERDEILTGHGIRASDVHPAVASSLRNPRLLGIALELLDKADVTTIEELNISRLLFEHIRMSERDAVVPQPMYECVRQLQKHAQEIVSRLRLKQQEDLKVFEENVGAVADGRFYQAVDGDPARYALKDDGLTLALGLLVIDRLRTAQRNGYILDAELEAILEPVAALDDTAKVILAALTVTAADERFERNIASSLVRGFATLQNPDHTQFPVFAGVAKRRPQGFMQAARALSLAGGRQSNFDWIQEALIVASRYSLAWQEMASEVQSWLSVYSLSPDRGMFAHPANDPQEKVQEEREKRCRKVEENISALSTNERAILRNLTTEEGDLSALSRLGLILLVGKALAPFASSLLNWSFANAVNPDHAAPYKEFGHLVSLNRNDWPQARTALLKVSEKLREAVTSTTGKWTLVNILHATGHPEDGREARSLAEDLTKDRPSLKSWRLIEDYCATDPCDPASEQPENIARTAELYAAIDVSKLRQSMGHTSEDHFFVMARPGIVRFKADIAVTKHREFAANVLSRAGFPLRQGLFELREHNALLTINEAGALIKKWENVKKAGAADGLSARDMWIVSQYLLLLAFPFFSAREQADILLSNETDEDILLDLMARVKTLGKAEFEMLLGSACSEETERKQYLLLALANYASIELSRDTRTRIAALIRSESERVRAQALRAVAQSGDEWLLRQVVESNWRATDSESENGLEEWYGSVALLEAAARELIPHGEALDRISPRLYGRAAAMLDADAAREIARRIDASIYQAAGLGDDLVAPDVEVQIHPNTLYEPGRFSVNEWPVKANDINEAMRRFSESKEAFEERQKRICDSFREFKINLTRAKAGIILDYLSLDEFATVVAADEALANRWHRLFMNIAEAKLPHVHNLVLLLAHALERSASEKAEELFRRVKNSKPLMRFAFGSAGVQLDAIAAWAGARIPALDNLRFQRLDRMGTDHDLSLEVLAALLNGQQELLTTYIEAKVSMEQPSEICRGIMVAGFSDQSEFNDEVLRRYAGSGGLIASAQEAAKYAYRRNVWARHWFEKMCHTDADTDFWRYAILLSKIVDGRFTVWCGDYTQKGNSIRLFGSVAVGKLESRIARWEDQRKRKLFGSEAPAPIFIDGDTVSV